MDADPSQVAAALARLGCPPERTDVMSAQLLKRAGQLAAERGWTPPDALAHLLRLMAGGWAAQAQGLAPFETPSPPKSAAP
ncbi:MAG: hypothetical protein ACKOEQ_13690 [Verrucomicrobiota bacterium]